MIKSERIAKKINEKIRARAKGHAKLIVAVDGYAGSGKTTVADFIAKQNSDVLTVHLDDFIHHRKDRERKNGENPMFRKVILIIGQGISRKFIADMSRNTNRKTKRMSYLILDKKFIMKI